MADSPIRRFHRQLADLRENGGRTPCEGRLDEYYSTSRIVQLEASESCLHCELLSLCYQSCVAEEAAEPAEGICGVRAATTPSERRRLRRAGARRTA